MTPDLCSGWPLCEEVIRSQTGIALEFLNGLQKLSKFATRCKLLIMQVASLRVNKNQAYDPEAIVWFQLRCCKPGKNSPTLTELLSIWINVDGAA